MLNHAPQLLLLLLVAGTVSGAWSNNHLEKKKEKGAGAVRSAKQADAEWILKRIQSINENEVDEFDKKKLSRQAVSDLYKSVRGDKHIKSDRFKDASSEFNAADAVLE